MTPLQKSIAEIEAEIAENEKQVEYYEEEGLKNYVLFMQSVIDGLNRAISILTANLEYERDVIKDAYTQGHDDACDGNAGQRKEFTSGNDYYTKTYNNERKD